MHGVVNGGLRVTRWNIDPVYDRLFPETLETPFSPVQRALKFSTVFGTVFPNNPITILPAGAPAMETSKYTVALISSSPAEA